MNSFLPRWPAKTSIYGESFDFPPTPSQNIDSPWLPYHGISWNASYLQGKFVLKNTRSPHSARSHGIKSQQLSQAPLACQVTVDLSKRPTLAYQSGAGLEMGNSPHSSHVRFLVHPNQGFSFWYWEHQRYHCISSGKDPRIWLTGNNQLGLLQGDGWYALFTNGQCIQQVSVKETTKGYVGIVAKGTGEFHFDNFFIY